MPIKVRDMIKEIEADGWYHVRTAGSHRHYKHATKPGIVTVAGKPSSDIPTGTERNIRKQAGL
ncbi:type II toxin-antitoxin system HicA family toxin [Kutzneria kofuensis]